MFLFSTLGPTQPLIQWIPEFFPGVKRPGHQVDHSPPSSTVVKSEWSYTSTPHIYLHRMNRDNYTFCTFTTGCNTSVFFFAVLLPIIVDTFSVF
jgi:hypothetical protein